MTDLMIQFHPCESSDSCDLCGRETSSGDGPHLLRADTHNRVCRNCGSKHAPSLVALLDLARTAQRVGRIGHHTLVPPMTALLDLARAAEDYTRAAPSRRRPAVAAGHA
jgi:hypothetical protein